MEDVKEKVEDTTEESSPETTESPEDVYQEETSAESEGKPEDKKEEGEAEGQPIPYPRFKQVNAEKNELKAKFEAAEKELEGIRGHMESPKVLRAIMTEAGYSEDKIKEELANRGISEAPKTDKKYDFNSVEGWQSWFNDQMDERLGPLKNEMAQKEKEAWLASTEAQAKNLAENVYGLEYGTYNKDEANPNTAIGRMSMYLQQHPEDSSLGYAKLLMLAMAEDAPKLGEQKGVQKEKARIQNLKDAQMEGDRTVGKDERPDSSWSVAQLMEWSRKHNK